VGRRLKLELGAVYGRLTVLGFAGLNHYNAAIWNCRCKCGKEVAARGTTLVAGNKLSCSTGKTLCPLGRGDREPWKGRRFGFLEVIEDGRAIQRPSQKHPAVLCRCDCGQEKLFPRGVLAAGLAVQCNDCRYQASLKDPACPCGTKDLKAYAASQKNFCVRCDRTRHRNGLHSCGHPINKVRLGKGHGSKTKPRCLNCEVDL